MRAALLGLGDGDRELLERWVRSSTIAAGSAQRARIVLLDRKKTSDAAN